MAPAVVFQSARERLQDDPLGGRGLVARVGGGGRILKVSVRGIGPQGGEQLAGHPGGHPALVSPGLVEANTSGGCDQAGGSRRRQRSRVSRAVQQRNDPLKLG